MSAIKIDDYNNRMRRAERNRNIAAVLIIALVVFAFNFGCWWFGRRVNYTLLYEDMVRATVSEMVQPEALKK